MSLKFYANIGYDRKVVGVNACYTVAVTIGDCIFPSSLCNNVIYDIERSFILGWLDSGCLVEFDCYLLRWLFVEVCVS